MICLSFFLINPSTSSGETKNQGNTNAPLFSRANAYKQPDLLKYHFVIEVKG
jgi:hypothetical protein